MSEEKSVKEVDLVIPMLHNIETAATKTAAEIAKYMEFDADKIDELNQALIEACINAFEHSKSRDNKLYIKFVMQTDELTVIIKDNGTGFDSSKVDANPTISKKLKSDYKRGWGIMLIKNLMDKVEIDSDSSGTTLKMTKIR